jgi:hypothetical protein
MRAQSVTIAVGPNQSLLVGRYELAMRRQETTLGIDAHGRAVEGSARIRAFDDTEHHENAGALCRACDLAQLETVDIDGSVEIGAIRFLLSGIVEVGAVSQAQPEGVARQVRLAESDQARAGFGGTTNPLHDARGRFLAIEKRRRVLDTGNTHGLI